MRPKILIFSGYGLNCDEETKFAFEKGGGKAVIAHINDVIDKKYILDDFQILVFQGGFAYGDDTGSGNAYANKIRNHLWKDLLQFIKEDRLIIGICNGFQILVNLGLLPALNNKIGNREVALTNNDNARYTVRFTDLKVGNDSPWLKGITEISLPIAHGEGKLVASEKVIREMEKRNQIALKYINGTMNEFFDLPYNPNGSTEDIAGITDKSGRILGLMPHPERAIFIQQMPNWQNIKEEFKRADKEIPAKGPGIKIFENAVGFFQ